MTVGQSVTLTWSASPGSKCAAASGPTKSAFSGAIEVGGSLKVTQTTAGTETYQIQCTAVGTPEVDSPTVSVVWTWPAVTATISASPTTLTAGQSTTLTWKSANATSCTATGGGADDNWAGTKATSGSQAVTEAVALDAASVLTFGITCNSTASGLSDKASVNVTENPAPASSGGGGGGGALNPVSLVFLAGILALRRVRGRIAGGLDGLRWASVGSEYDPRKSAENKRKQGIDFEEAQALWSDPGLLEISQQAPRKSDRFPAYSWGTLAQLRSMKRPEL
jgi:hypothetical protein